MVNWRDHSSGWKLESRSVALGKERGQIQGWEQVSKLLFNVKCVHNHQSMLPAYDMYPTESVLKIGSHQDPRLPIRSQKIQRKVNFDSSGEIFLENATDYIEQWTFSIQPFPPIPNHSKCKSLHDSFTKIFPTNNFLLYLSPLFVRENTMSVIAVSTIGRATREGDFSSTVENDSVVSETLKKLLGSWFSSILRSWLKHFEKWFNFHGGKSSESMH